MTTIACDIDLRKCYAVADTGDIVCKKTDSLHPAYLYSMRKATTPVILLCEIGSPLLYGDLQEKQKMELNKLRWLIWNIAEITRFNTFLGGPGNALLVSPSHKWTMGHSEAVRQKAAMATHKERNLRECEAMLFFYKHHPENWVPLAKYLEDL